MSIIGMSRVYDDERLAGVYQGGNEMPDESLRDWLAQTRRFNSHPAVQYLAGTAEAVPTRPHLFDLARILRPGGVVVIRTTFRERLDALVYDYWPRLRELDEQRFPSKPEVLEDFAAAGFAVRAVTSFARPVTTSLREYHARMTSQPQSKFTQLTAAEFREGLRRLKADAQDEPVTCPVVVAERYDLAVLSPSERRR